MSGQTFVAFVADVLQRPELLGEVVHKLVIGRQHESCGQSVKLRPWRVGAQLEVLLSRHVEEGQR